LLGTMSKTGGRGRGPRGPVTDVASPHLGGTNPGLYPCQQAHHGWLVHSAPPNESKQDRKALTISFVATAARRLGVKGIRQAPNDVDRSGYKPVVNDALLGNTHEAWIQDIKPGQPCRHVNLPRVYTRPGGSVR
jgi:hypothetical protein